MITETAKSGLAETRALAHPHCAVCSGSNNSGLQLEFTVCGPGRVLARFDCLDAHEGYPGIVHGGVITSAIDGAMTNSAIPPTKMIARHRG